MRLRKFRFSIIIAICLVLAGCGSTGGGTVKKTLDNPKYTDLSYSNILVIGVGGDYSNRAYFERAMVSRIEAGGAAAYYSVVGRNQPITRSTVSTVVKSRGFDALLLARVISQDADISVEAGTSETKVSRKAAGRAVDLFRYDYDELTEPGVINVLSTVTISAEIFSGADETGMSAIKPTINDKENVGQIIEAAADTIMAQLKKDGLIGR